MSKELRRICKMFEQVVLSLAYWEGQVPGGKPGGKVISFLMWNTDTIGIHQRKLHAERAIQRKPYSPYCKYTELQIYGPLNHLLVFNKQSTTSVHYNLILKSLHLRLSCGWILLTTVLEVAQCFPQMLGSQSIRILDLGPGCQLAVWCLWESLVVGNESLWTGQLGNKSL